MPCHEAGGIHLRYEEWGIGREPLLFIHGLGSSADDWFMQLPAFAPHYRCVAVDLRGHGLSDKPAGAYSVPLFAADVAGLLAAINATPAHVWGLSLGGMVAQQLAIAHPSAVRSLVLLNTLPGLWPLNRQIVRTGLRRLSPPWRPVSMAQRAARIAADLFPGPQHAFLRRQAEARLAANDPAAYQRAVLAVARFLPGAALGQIACPTLIMAGTEDRVVPAAYQARLRQALPHATFIALPGSGHASNVDAPEVVNEAVLAFLRAIA